MKGTDIMCDKPTKTLAELLPVWDALTDDQRALLEQQAEYRRVPKGTLLQGNGHGCIGLLLISEGQIREYILSDAGKEVTLYRLFAYDLCVFSASCMMRGIQFDVNIETEKDTELYVIPASLFTRLTHNSLAMSNYLNEILQTRFSEVMWLMDKVLFKRIDTRLAAFLLEEIAIEGDPCLEMTHEKIAQHVGTAREVITRMLKYFQTEGIVKLSRGGVTVIDEKKLAQFARS